MAVPSKLPKGPNKEPNNKGAFRGRLRRLYNLQRIYGYAAICAVFQFFRRHKKLPKIPKRTGDVAVITGGARGIGLEAVRQLLQADMHVIIGCRDISKGEEAINGIRNDGVKTGRAECHYLDLRSFESTRKFASVVKMSTKHVNILINNAAVMDYPYDITEDGFITTFQVNYLSHFLLTYLLTPWLILGGKNTENSSRVVHISTLVVCNGEIIFDDLMMEKFHCRIESYSNSKLMQIVSSNYLDLLCQKESWPMRSLTAHPGICHTDLFKHSVLQKFIWVGNKLIGKTPKQSADDYIFAALGPENHPDIMKTGVMLSNCSSSYPHPEASNKNTQLKLWNETCKMLGLDPDLKSTISDDKPFGDVPVIVDIV